eukprot:6196651-Pleurochrysis_carterae.AAC.8
MRVAATDVGARGGAAWQGVRTAQSLAARTWPTSFSTHVNRGLRWAVHDEKRRGGLSGSLRATLRLSWLLLESLLLFPLSKLPFAIEAWRYRNDHVQLVQLANTTLEVYAPVTAQGHCCEDIAKTVLFVHGGSWAQGAPWQYSLLAQKLIQRTEAVVVIAQYRLFPDGCVDDMVRKARLNRFVYPWAFPRSSAMAVLQNASLKELGFSSRRSEVVYGSCIPHACALICPSAPTFVSIVGQAFDLTIADAVERTPWEE